MKGSMMTNKLLASFVMLAVGEAGSDSRIQCDIIFATGTTDADKLYYLSLINKAAGQWTDQLTAVDDEPEEGELEEEEQEDGQEDESEEEEDSGE